ncbi:ABC transporter ATP-binding protein [uncultured Martelella sp.]|uniref:ABC transporter ATP-binding protein n=1 Tax=uncultured Martelella sp. TaxID=392331 RepID=UPI0029C90D42|nr:ABC transporter ATP-binding protein [uncultured Martelella sp.]
MNKHTFTNAETERSASVDIKDLTVAFGSLAVLDKMNVDIKKGEFLVLLGPSGCGKSTLLNTIAGLQEARSGQIRIGGRDVINLAPKDRGIAMVFQSYALYPTMTVEKNLSFGLRVAKTPKAEIERRVKRAAEILELTPFLKRRPGALSGGQRQRVAIGRALVREVDIFLFDEPLSNLDAQLRAELRVEIKRLHQRLGNTMIYVTHDQIEALTLADRIAVMKDGVIQQLDEPEKVYAEPANLFVAGFIGSPSMNFIEGTVATVGSAPVLKSKELEIPLAASPSVDAVREGQKVTLGIRPDSVLVAENAATADYRWDAEVELREPLGGEALVWCGLGEKNFCIKVNAGLRVKTGDTLKSGFNLAEASLFDTESGQRL